MSLDNFENKEGYTTHSETPTVVSGDLDDYHPAVTTPNRDQSKLRLKLEKNTDGDGDYISMIPIDHTGWSGDHKQIFENFKLRLNPNIPNNCIEAELNKPIKTYYLVKFKLSYIKTRSIEVYQADLKWKFAKEDKYAYSKWFWIPD